MEHLDANLAELSLGELEARLEALDSSVPSDEITGFLVEHGVLSPIRAREDDNDSADESGAGQSCSTILPLEGKAEAGGHGGRDEEKDTAARDAQREAVVAAGGEGEEGSGGERGCFGQAICEQEQPEWRQQGFRGEGHGYHGPRQPSNVTEGSWAALSVEHTAGPSDLLTNAPVSKVAEGNQRQHSRSGSSQAVQTPLQPPAFNLSEANPLSDRGGGRSPAFTDDGLALQPCVKGSAASGPGDSWAVLDRVLSQEGYRPLSSNDPHSILTTVMQVLEEHKDRGERIKALIAEKGRREGDEQRSRDKVEALEKERSTLQAAMKSTSTRTKELEAELETVKRTMGDKLKEAKVKCSNLSLQLRQSEHRVKSKEASMDQLLAKLEAMRERESRSKERERAVFRRLHQREPNRSSDSRMLDSLSVLEDARQRTQEEVKALREEVRSLNDLLKDRENYIMRKETGGLWQRNGTDESIATQEHLLEKCRELERERRHACVREESLLQRVDELQASLHKTQAQVEGLEEDKTNLILELKSRPTQRAWRNAESRIKELEMKLVQAQDHAKEATDVRELRKYMGVAELVRRDKANHRLGLNRVDDLPREVIQDMVKECCRILEVDVFEVVPSVNKLVRVVTSLPRLERFARDVCTFVSAKAKGGFHAAGTAVAPQDYVNRLTMEEVMHEIKQWWQGLQDTDQLKSFRARLISRLLTRVDSQQGSPASEKAPSGLSGSDEAILGVVTELIEVEKRLMQSRELHEGAAALLTAQPDVFIHRVVEHFRYLFQVKSVDGLFPKMNALYLFTSEMENFTKALRSMLGVEAGTSTTALLTALQDALHVPAYPRQMTALPGKSLQLLQPRDSQTDAGGGVSRHGASLLSESEEEPS